MHVQPLSCYGTALCFATALLSGCSGSQPPIGAPGAMLQSRAIAQHAFAQGKSWMLQDAKSQDLLYVSDASATVSVYTFPTLRKVESFSLSNTSAGGECSDNAGNVFISSANADRVGTIYEYAHGGSSPVAALSDPGLPYGCAVDPMSGNLAVSNVYDASNPSRPGLGDVAIYDHAQGSPTMYQSSAIDYLLYCTFDSSGNLIADGADGDGVHALFEIASGSKSVTEISLDPAVRSLGSLQWDGRYLSIADYSSNIHERHGPQVIDRLQISKGSAKS